MPEFRSALLQAVQVVLKALSPPPKYSVTPGNDDSTKDTGLFQDILELSPEDYKTLVDSVKVSTSGEEDDGGLFLERLVTLLSRLPPHSHAGKQFTNGLVNTLWDVLDHPPLRTLRNDLAFRQADGSYNNPNNPLLGAAGTAYARTTPALVFQNPNLPNAELIFDTLMTRGDGSNFRGHPNKLSSILFYLATIITHDCFQTVGIISAGFVVALTIDS